MLDPALNDVVLPPVATTCVVSAELLSGIKAIDVADDRIVLPTLAAAVVTEVVDCVEAVVPDVVEDVGIGVGPMVGT